MKILLTGAAGQLGQALRQQVPAGVELIATCRSGGNGLLALDLAEAEACRAAIRDHRPDWVLNAGAYTAVDKAESEPELALAVNGGAPRAFAEALLETGGRLLQVSPTLCSTAARAAPTGPSRPAILSAPMAAPRQPERKRWSSCLAPLLAAQGQGGE